MNITYIDANTNSNKPFTDEQIVAFLHTHLDQYGDDEESISRCLNFAMGRNNGLGGFAVVASDGTDIIGVVIVNKTGMGGYIPENILVYIASHRKYRGKGVGKALMDETLKRAVGDIALHVEKDNPARFMYEKYGFTNPYLEMRLKR